MNRNLPYLTQRRMVLALMGARLRRHPLRVLHVLVLLAARPGNAGRVIVLLNREPSYLDEPHLHTAGICGRRRGNPCTARY